VTVSTLREQGGLERWIAEQRWEAILGGWRVRERFQGWRFRLAGARPRWGPHRHVRVRGSAGEVDRAELAGTKNTNVM
jgi:hypothetical protein